MLKENTCLKEERKTNPLVVSVMDLSKKTNKNVLVFYK